MVSQTPPNNPSNDPDRVMQVDRGAQVDRGVQVDRGGPAGRGPYGPDRRRSPWGWLLALLAAIAVAVVLFFALGGDADVDTDGGNVDVQTPDVDADVDAPNVDADVDIDEGDADADADANVDE